MTQNPVPYRKKLNNLERKTIKGIAEGRNNPNSRISREILQRPHVAIALESILDQAGLNDEKLCVRIRAVVNRKPIKSLNRNTGTKSTNQTAVDANAVQAIRTIWQVKQYFKESSESAKIPLGALTEDALDNIIASGADVVQMIQVKQKEEKDKNAGNA